MSRVHTPGLSEFPDHPAPEAFEVVEEPTGQRRFWFVCPGCKWISAIALRPVSDGSPQSWEFNGNMNAPTLHPSINHVDCWHGWLRDGKFVAA